MKNLILILSLLAVVIGCTENVYTIDDLRNIGFDDSGNLDISETARFVGTYEYIISEGNSMELTKRYPVRLQVIATMFEDVNSAKEYHNSLKESPSEFYGAYYKCFINNLYIGIKKDPNYNDYQKVCDYISIDLK